MTDLAITRPQITLPAAEEAAVRAYYGVADVILEYGSGGSTVIAAELEGKTVFSVESDAKWLKGMQAYFTAFPPLARLTLHHGKIGPTKEWGHPKSDDEFRKWSGYPLSVWDLEQFVHPDVVLIDGRFRAACFLTTLFRITKPTTVLWDDYSDRKSYHEVETLVKPIKMFGRMACFELTPMPIPADRLQWILQTYLRAN